MVQVSKATCFIISILVFLQKAMHNALQCTVALFISGPVNSSLFSYVIMAYGHKIRYILIFVGHTGSKRMLIQEYVVLVEITFTKMHTVITMLLFCKNYYSIAFNCHRFYCTNLTQYNKTNNPPFHHVGYFHRALILFIEGHIAFKGNRAQASALIGSEMFWAEWLIEVVCLKHQFKYVLPPIYPFIFSPLRGSTRGPKSQRCEV